MQRLCLRIPTSKGIEFEFQINSNSTINAQRLLKKHTNHNSISFTPILTSYYDLHNKAKNLWVFWIVSRYPEMKLRFFKNNIQLFKLSISIYIYNIYGPMVNTFEISIFEMCKYILMFRFMYGHSKFMQFCITQ